MVKHSTMSYQLFVKSPLSNKTSVIQWSSLSKDDEDKHQENNIVLTAGMILNRLLLLNSCCNNNTKRKSIDDNECIIDYEGLVTNNKRQRLLEQNAYMICNGKVIDEINTNFFTENNISNYSNNNSICNTTSSSFSTTIQPTIEIRLRICGGIDRQNRVGSKFGGGGVSSQQQSERERKERLKKLALESIDLAKDPYLVKNHLGSYECKLCLTLHRDEANYLSHTQGKKHQQGLARRAYLEKLQAEREGKASALPVSTGDDSKPSAVSTTRIVKIGRPAYQVYKSRDPDTNQRCLSFEIQYPEIDNDLQPRHRFMSSYEQRVESKQNNYNYQYLLFAAQPYETIAFKVPNEPIDKGDDRFVTHWDDNNKKFTLTLYFMEPTGTAEKKK